MLGLPNSGDPVWIYRQQEWKPQSFVANPALPDPRCSYCIVATPLAKQ